MGFDPRLCAEATGGATGDTAPIRSNENKGHIQELVKAKAIERME